MESNFNLYSNSDIAMTVEFAIDNAEFIADVAAVIAELTLFSISPNGLADYLQNAFNKKWPHIVAQAIVAFGKV